MTSIEFYNFMIAEQDQNIKLQEIEEIIYSNVKHVHK